ncbi:MAG: isoprenyl transferase [Candidatus Orphnella occulta]|nr:isoprenyl transferase [Candidatus Orphnella occulta]
MINKTNLPRHIAIIMDGNGRWAKRKRLPRIFGHREGTKSVDVIVQECAEIGIEALTLYTFSTENWKRSDSEISGLMNLLHTYLDKKYKKMQSNGIKLNAIGRLDELPEKVRDKLCEIIKKTSKNDRMILTLALNYGGRQEITDAAKQLVKRARQRELSPDDVDEELFSNYLYTKGLPDVDLLIRTSGEFRVSNFLLWQISYAEIIVTKTLWPDFKKEQLFKVIEDYQKRDRRFGGR